MRHVSGTDVGMRTVTFGRTWTFRNQSSTGSRNVAGHVTFRESGMNTINRNAEVLVREGIRQHTGAAVATVTPVTHTIVLDGEEQHDDLLPRIGQMRAALQAGNVKDAVRIGHLISGRSARLGERRVAGMVRKVVTMSRFYVLEQADAILAQAEAELISKN